MLSKYQYGDLFHRQNDSGEDKVYYFSLNMTTLPPDCPEIFELRNNIHIPFKCPITGEIITDKHLIHIDHYDMEFQDVFDLWMKGRNVNELYEKTRNSSVDGDMRTWFNDNVLVDDFIKFHDCHTHLRAVSRKANLTVLRKC